MPHHTYYHCYLHHYYASRKGYQQGSRVITHQMTSSYTFCTDPKYVKVPGQILFYMTGHTNTTQPHAALFHLPHMVHTEQNKILPLSCSPKQKQKSKKINPS